MKSNNEIISRLEKNHNWLKGQFKNKGNKEDAEKAEKFLNWLIFKVNKEVDNTLNLVLYNELIEQYPEVLDIVNKIYFNSVVTQNYDILMKDNKILEKEYGKFSQERGIELEEDLSKIINTITGKEIIGRGGQELSTVIIDPLIESYIKKLSYNWDVFIKKNTIQESGFIRTAYKSGKRDTKLTGQDTQIFTYNFPVTQEFENYLKSTIKCLSNASIKSVKDINSIDLESVQIEKAYSAFYNIGKFKQQRTNIKKIYDAYYGKDKTSNPDPNVTYHLNHIIKVYGYSGFGTTYLINDLKEVYSGVDYLLVVDNIKEEIKVVPSSIIVNYLMSYGSKKGITADVVLNLKAALDYRK